LKNIIFRRSYVFGIVLLFIGLSITSSIHGYGGNNSNQSMEDASMNFPLNDDYVNGYWKFDEGNGNIAYDSSEHGYDGTIYGATWVAHDSDYALDFNGQDSYVSLDNYAKSALGFNKTDDLIFSFDFKSSLDGIIFGISESSSLNPGAVISLKNDGTLEFIIRVLGCGLTLTSEGTYDDGSWHHAELIYNGISANPTVTLYVDEELDTSITEWVCAYTANEFNKAKIGSHSYNSSDYFDGIIDEFKIIKYPGGNQQNPPSISGPDKGEPGVEYDFTFVINDPEGEDVQLYIDWDDGTYEEFNEWYESGEEVVFSHTWVEDDKYEIVAKSQDFWHDSHSSKHVVRIGNQPPVSPEISGQKYGDTNQEITYTFKAYDLENENIKYKIDWDDGTIDETNYYPSNTSVEISHDWDTKDDYNITAVAIDTHGKPGDQSEYHIRIGDKPPEPPTIYGEVRGIPDVFYEYGIISIDPESDNLSYDIDWGDGNVETDIGPFSSGEIFPREHKWNETGNYIIKSRAKDEFGYYGEWSEREIVVPLNKAFNFNLLDLLFERFPLAHLIFKSLQGLSKYDIIIFGNLKS